MKKSTIMKRLITLFLTMVIFAGFSTNVNAQEVEVTFNVNMEAFADTSDFDPTTDAVYVAGEVQESDWSEPGTDPTAMMTDTDGDLTYTWSAMLPADSMYQYKFFYVPAEETSSWDYGEWAGGDNRVVHVGAESMELFEMWGVYSQMVTFNVDMATFADTTDFDPAADEVYISGEVLGADWSEPGTNPNAMMTDEDGDLTYTWSAYLPQDSSYQYKYFYVPEGEGSSWSYGEWEGGDNRMFDVGMSEMSLYDEWGIYSYKATFNVDMTTFADTSDFDPANDTVYISGEVLGADWSEPGTEPDAMMTDEDGDLTYTWSTYMPADSTYQYKYFYVPAGEGSSWDYGDWLGGENRKLDMPADQMITMNEMWGMFNIYFHVTEDGSAPLEGAEVTVGDWTKTTDAEGMATLYGFPNDSVSYTVTHDDYEDYMWGVGVEWDHVDVMVDMSTAGIGDGNENEIAFNMYPNPTSGVLNVEGLDNVQRIEIYNSIGQQMNVIENVNNTIQVRTGNLETGVYFVNFYNEQGVVTTQKFLKQ